MAVGVDQLDIGSVANDSSTDHIIFTTTAAVVSGGFIVLTLTWNHNSGTLSSVSGGGLTWTIDKQTTNQGAFGFCCGAIVSAQAPSGLASGTTIDATLSANAQGRSMAGTSFTGIATTSALDTTSGPTTPGTGTAWATASTTVASGSVLVGVAIDMTSINTNTPTSPSVEMHDINGGGTSFSQAAEYRIGTGAITVAGTWASSVDNHVVIAAAYKSAGGATTNKTLTASQAQAPSVPKVVNKTLVP